MNKINKFNKFITVVIIFNCAASMALGNLDAAIAWLAATLFQLETYTGKKQ
tara:strand:+ start:643 stop:795 length:153 start_codon:yes stop_codon:yes gene_type:complete